MCSSFIARIESGNIKYLESDEIDVLVQTMRCGRKTLNTLIAKPKELLAQEVLDEYIQAGSVGKFLRTHRQAQRLTWEELAQKNGMSSQEIRSIEIYWQGKIKKVEQILASINVELPQKLLEVVEFKKQERSQKLIKKPRRFGKPVPLKRKEQTKLFLKNRAKNLLWLISEDVKNGSISIEDLERFLQYPKDRC